METTQTEKWSDFHKLKSARQQMSSGLRSAWERALIQGIDPYTVRPPEISKEQREKVKRKSKQLLVYTESIKNAMIGSAWEEKNFCALLFSKEGVLIKIYSNNHMEKWLDAHGIKRWTSWAEEYIGPNIFSIGFQNRLDTVMMGEENFAHFLLDGAWYFSTISLADGNALGGLAIVTPSNYATDLLRNLTASICKNVELHLLWFNMLHDATDITEGMGFMALDQSNGENRLLSMSNEIFKMLGIPIDDYYYLRVEKYIDQFPKNREFWNIVENKIGVSDKTVRLICRGKPVDVCISTSIYREPKFHIDGLVIVFNSSSRIQRLASKCSGNVAHFCFDTIVGKNECFLEAIHRGENAAISESNVLLLGESGTGKDVVAQAIHNASFRRKGAFVAINCASFSKELITSELFGYEEGAFTGARRGGNIGKFELANNGTLFLDEIGDMPLDLQAVLLRTLEERSFMKVGGNRMINVNVRIIAATNKNLYEKMRNGLFREDLFYRLGVVRIKIPSLRQRENDVLLLSECFIKSICARQNRREVSLTPDAKRFFLSYQWPGNVRELQNLLEGIISTHNDNLIDEDTIIRYLSYEGIEAISTEKAPSFLPSEKEQMEQALRQNKGNRSKAAETLGMSRSTFYRRLREYRLETETSRGTV